MTRQPSAGFAQFFPAAPRAARDRATEREKARAKTTDPATAHLTSQQAANIPAGDFPTSQSPAGDGSLPNGSHHPPTDDRGSPTGDTLHNLGSASSYASTGSSVFSAAARQPAPNGTSQIPISSLTPLTAIDSPSHPAQSIQTKSTMPVSDSNDQLDIPAPATQPNGAPHASSSHIARVPARNPNRSRKGFKCTYDPNLERSLTKDKKTAKPVIKEFGLDDDDAPPPDPRLDESGGLLGYINTDFHLARSRFRQAPYNLRPYPFDPKTSLGPGPPTQILVIGFNPLINFSRLSQSFASFGDVAESSNKMHPETGSYLGFATFRYKDALPSRARPVPVKAMDAARRAVRSMNGHKIESHQIRVEFDPEGKKSRRMLEEVLRKEKEAQNTQTSHTRAVPTGPRSTAPTPAPGPPLLAPRGPALQRPVAPFPVAAPVSKAPMQPKQHILIENDSVAPQVAAQPYIFVPGTSVPVMSTTVPHMKKRLKAYQFEDIRVDRTGYFILFPNTHGGCEEARRCERIAKGTEFFNYEFRMQLRLPSGGGPEIPTQPKPRRTPSPDRTRRTEFKAREDKDRRRREEENDLEEEKRQRAKNFDPVPAACEVVLKELAEHLIKHIRTRVAAPALTAYLNPANHTINRRKLGLEDAIDRSQSAGVGDESPRVGTPNSGADPIERRTGRLEVAALPRIRKVKGNKKNLQQNQALTELYGRRRATVKRSAVVRSLHHRLQSFDSDAESEDDGDARASVARETEEPESRPRSRMSTDDELSRDDLASWGPEDRDDDSMTDVSFAVSKKRKLEPEAQNALKRQKKSDEKLFGVTLDHIDTELPGTGPPVHDISEEATPDVDIEARAASVEQPPLAAGKALLKQKTKRKTKKQIFEEREAKKQLDPDRVRVEEVLPDVEEPVEKVKIEEPAAPQPPVEITDFDLFSHDVSAALELPDDFTLDLFGLQAASLSALDAPDMARLRKKYLTADMEDPLQWLWSRNRVRDVNMNLATNEQRKIEGYYVGNATGCARTEGVKKILNSEKSKYLPHHIKVQKAREAREAKNKKDGKDSTAAVPAPPAPAKGNSRANRASNRRHVTLLQDELKTSTDPDVFKFNALKKRKKPVKFARSAIHNWGLYTEENINKDDMIIEYVGEQVRQQISEIREKKYLKQGMGSSYLFRIDEDTVIDATKKGGIARFINHSCMPNCTAKIIKVDGSKRIVIYALRDIPRNEELTYDYKFEREINSLDRIPCLCGTALCKGFLN